VVQHPAWWVVALVAWLLVAILGLKRVEVNGTVLAVLLTGLYALSSWAMTVATGTGEIVDTARALFVTSLLAAMISSHNTTARYVFALGRERVLPSVFGRTDVRTGAPKAGSVAQSVLGLVVIVLYAVLGLDPLVQLFF
jgi:amino acid transporter